MRFQLVMQSIVIAFHGDFLNGQVPVFDLSIWRTVFSWSRVNRLGFSGDKMI